MANLPDGEVFVAGREKARVIRLLEISRELKIDERRVRTTNGGYVVPAPVADQYEQEVADAAKADTEPSTPKAAAKATTKATGPRKKSTSD